MNRRARRAQRSSNHPPVEPVQRAHRAAACPDCTAPVVAGYVVHEDSCPLLAQLERTTAADAVWFRWNPGSHKLVRPTTPAERTEQALIRPIEMPDREVTLVRQARGSYQRQFAPSGRVDMLLVSGE